MRKKHPNKEIEAALKHAEENGWLVQKSGKSSHAWGKLLCPYKIAGAGHTVSQVYGVLLKI